MRFHPTRHISVALFACLSLLLLSGCQILSSNSRQVISVANASLSFGTVPVGSSKSVQDTLTNNSGSSVTIGSVTGSSTTLQLVGFTPPQVLAAGQSLAITVRYHPSATGNLSQTLTFLGADSKVLTSISVAGTAANGGIFSLNPSQLSFGSVTVGSNQKTNVTISNTGTGDLTINQATLSGAGFAIGNMALPMTLHAGNSASTTVTFAPPSSGSFSGSVTFATADAQGNVSLPLTGTGITAGQLGDNPSSLSFGSIAVGTSTSLSETLTNTGGASVTISQATISGAGLSVSGLSLPTTLAGNQSLTFKVKFAPTTAGAVSGQLAITSDVNSLNINLTGTGLASGSLTPNPSSMSFGGVAVGASKSLSGTVTNSGGTSLTISSTAVTGNGFSISGLSVPVTLNPGQSATFAVRFAPGASGAASGAVSINSNGANSNLSIPLSGTGVAPASLSANPTSQSFGNVQVGSANSNSETLTNTGGATATISQANVTGAGFSVSGLTLPATLTAGQSVTFTVKFAPASAGTVSGNLSLVSDASNSPLSIALSGNGTTPGQLAASPTTLNFGSVTVGSSSALAGTLTASGAPVTVSSASTGSSEFTLSGIALPATLAAGQSAGFTVTFKPATSGTAGATVTFSSNATNAPTQQSVKGTGTAPGHSVALSWNASSGAVGYNIYRSIVSGGPYTIINASLNTSTSYTDSAVASGTTYYYVVTAVGNDSNESGYSSQVTAAVPTP